MLPVLSAIAAPGLQTRAQPLADLQIGVEESSLPRYSDMEFGYGDLEIVRGRAAIRRLHSAECFSFLLCSPFYQLLLRLVSRPERNPWPISRSAWRTRSTSLYLQWLQRIIYKEMVSSIYLYEMATSMFIRKLTSIWRSPVRCFLRPLRFLKRKLLIWHMK